MSFGVPEHCVVISEAGRPWAAWADTWRAFGGDVFVLAQGEAEPPSRFAQRVSQRLAALTASAGRLPRVVLLTGPDSGDEALCRRGRIVRLLVPVMNRARGVYLVPPASACWLQRDDLSPGSPGPQPPLLAAKGLDRVEPRGSVGWQITEQA